MLTGPQMTEWRERVKREVNMVVAERLDLLNRELGKEGWTLQGEAALTIEFQLMESYVFDKDFCFKAHVLFDLTEDENEWVKRAGLEKVRR